jgi:hypothetical protein
MPTAGSGRSLQVVAELSEDKTVEYIRSLEVAVARYRAEVQQVRNADACGSAVWGVQQCLLQWHARVGTLPIFYLI